MPELNPTTRTRLWYIVILLVMDAAVLLGLEQLNYIETTSPYALPLFMIGIFSVLVAACVGAFLLVTRPEQVDLKAMRQRE